MSKLAMVIRTKTQPGKRDDVRALYESHLAPLAEANEAQQLVVWCDDDGDPDTFFLFEIYGDRAALEANAGSPAFGEYMAWGRPAGALAGPLLAPGDRPLGHSDLVGGLRGEVAIAPCDAPPVRLQNPATQPRLGVPRDFVGRKETEREQLFRLQLNPTDDRTCPTGPHRMTPPTRVGRRISRAGSLGRRGVEEYPAGIVHEERPPFLGRRGVRRGPRRLVRRRLAEPARRRRAVRGWSTRSSPAPRARGP